MVYSGRNRNINNILQHFAVMWGITVFSVLIGSWLPSSVVTPFALICLLLIVVHCFLRHIRLPGIVLYVIPIFMGMLLLWVSEFFIHFLYIEEDIINTVFICTVIIFVLFAVAGLRIHSEITELISIMFSVILVVLVFTFAFAFFAVSNAFIFFIAAIFVLIVAMYVAYEFAMICSNYVRDDEVVWMALNLYLGLFTLIVNILEVARSARR